jgi:hypothetical protein
MKWCSQGAEAMHQVTKLFARKRSVRRETVSQVVLIRVHMLMRIRAQPSRRQRVRHTGKHVTGTGHVSKVKREVLIQAQDQVPRPQL